jgi:hypothetical protein
MTTGHELLFTNYSACTNGTEVGQNEGAFAAFGNKGSATADTNYTIDGEGASAATGNGNYAFVDGPANSTAEAGGGSDIAYITDPFSGATGPADSCTTSYRCSELRLALKPQSSRLRSGPVSRSPH